MIVSIIVAAAENNIIGHNNRIIWRLSDDMKRFKALTGGHTVIMGRKTFESLRKPLPERKNIVLTHNPNFIAEGCEIVCSFQQALTIAGRDNEVFIIGGSELYNEFWNKADKLYLTRVHTVVDGDASIPFVSPYWKELECTSHLADDKNEYNYSFITYTRKIDLTQFNLM